MEQTNLKKKYNIEFVSANPTGPLHVGHCRGAILGDVISNLLKFNGNKVVNEYYVNDLIGCKITHENGNFIGNVISVDNFGAGDLIETIYKENNIYIPLNDENVLSVNIENKKIIVNPIKGIINYD